MRFHCALSLLLFVATAAVVTPASAQAPAAAPPPTAAAQLLFDEGRELMKREDFAAACPKFVESHRLQPAGGTILHAASCHQSEGKLATAWTEFNEALSFALRDKRTDRERVARTQIEALGPQLGKLALDVASEARANTALVVTIDGTPLDRAAWSAPIPLDAGTHAIVASAPGFLELRTEAVVRDGEVGRLAIQPLAPDPTAHATTATQPSPQPRRTLAFVVGGVGAAGLVVGTIFGVRAMAIGDQSGECKQPPRFCPQGAVDDQNSARTSAAISTIGFAAGAVLLAAGVVLYLTAPAAKRTALTTLAGGLLGGTF
ncbi:MAG: hypothetical protein KIT84_01450 [Labilithrix sp.]|nr:hypothetical protein [Labilithrix sp.]MCW5809652.1 hypothetical protein [Labilithrix sp.]